MFCSGGFFFFLSSYETQGGSIHTTSINLVCAIKMAHRYKSRKIQNKLQDKFRKTDATKPFILFFRVFPWNMFELVWLCISSISFSLLSLVVFPALLFITWRIWLSSQRKRVCDPWELIIKKFPLNLWRLNTKYANALKYVEVEANDTPRKIDECVW